MIGGNKGGRDLLAPLEVICYGGIALFSDDEFVVKTHCPSSRKVEVNVHSRW
jgi:hypothetical protein